MDKAIIPTLLKAWIVYVNEGKYW